MDKPKIVTLLFCLSRPICSCGSEHWQLSIQIGDDKPAEIKIICHQCEATTESISLDEIAMELVFLEEEPLKSPKAYQNNGNVIDLSDLLPKNS